MKVLLLALLLGKPGEETGHYVRSVSYSNGFACVYRLGKEEVMLFFRERWSCPKTILLRP